MFNEDQQKQNAAMLDMDIQQEEVMAFFRDYWKPILGLMVILILVTAGIQVYRGWYKQVAGDQMAALLPLTAAPASVQSAKTLEEFAAKGATGSRKALALLYVAAKYNASAKPDEAKRVLTEITNSSAPEEMKNYARVLLVNASGDAKMLDKIGKRSAWQTAVSEQRALAETDAQKQRDAYGVIAADPKSPPALRARAAEFSGQTATE